MLSALARALRLYEAERAYLYHLVGEEPAPPAGPSPDVPAGVLHLLDRLDDTPAYVIDAKYDILAWNPLAAALLGDPAAWPPDRRNVIWNLFAGAHAEQVVADPASSAFADECVAELRAAAGPVPAGPGHRPTGRPAVRGQREFVRRWEQLRVCVRRGSTTRRVRHPWWGSWSCSARCWTWPGTGNGW